MGSTVAVAAVTPAVSLFRSLVARDNVRNRAIAIADAVPSQLGVENNLAITAIQ